jgi:PAS domain-containing protein
VVALAVELVFAVMGRWEALMRLLHGDRGPGSIVAVVRLFWLVFVLVIVGDVARAWLRTRRALHRRDQTIAAIGSTTHDWLWEADLAFTFTYHSPGVQDLLGYRPEELIGVAMVHLAGPELGGVRLQPAAATGAPALASGHRFGLGQLRGM